MDPIEFEPSYGKILYENISQFSGLLRYANRFPALTGRERDEAVSELITALSITAFGFHSNHSNLRTVEDWLDYHRRVVDHNREIFRLVTTPKPIEVWFQDGRAKRRIRFGHVLGCTMVFPLTDEGYERYTTTETPLSALFPSAVVEAKECRRDQLNLHLGATIDIRNLNHPKWQPDSSSRVFMKLFDHATFFGPNIEWRAGDEAYLVASSGSRLPRFSAYSTPNSKGSYLMEESGFRDVGKVRWAQLTDLKYALDLNDWNRGGFDDERREQVRLTVNAYQHRWEQSAGPMTHQA